MATLSHQLEKNKNLILNKVLPSLRSLILQVFKDKGIPYELKSDQSPVTEADRNCETLFREIIAKETPSFGVIGEEFGASHDGADWVWTIDPIDGTRAFSRGLPFWGIQIGLLYEGTPVMGIVDYPKLNDTLWGGKDLGTWSIRAQRKLELNSQRKLSELTLLHSGVSSFKDEKFLPKFLDLMNKIYLERAYGDCAAYYFLLMGQVDIVMDQALKPWDSVPFFPMIQEAKGSYLTLSGQKDWKQTAPFIAGTPAHVSQILKFLGTI